MNEENKQLDGRKKEKKLIMSKIWHDHEYDKRSDDIALKMNGINFFFVPVVYPSFSFPQIFRLLHFCYCWPNSGIWNGWMWNSTCESENTCMQQLRVRGKIFYRIGPSLCFDIFCSLSQCETYELRCKMCRFLPFSKKFAMNLNFQKKIIWIASVHSTVKRIKQNCFFFMAHFKIWLL